MSLNYSDMEERHDKIKGNIDFNKLEKVRMARCRNIVNCNKVQKERRL